MGSLYNRTDIYDLFEDERHVEAYEKHWTTVLDKKNIHTMLDVSIGTGGVTLPASKIGVQLSGSDLSEEMLKKCQKKADAMNYPMELKCTDFRDLSCWKNHSFDCVASTGNSLAYVTNEDVLKTLEQMDSLVKDGGYLYLDSRKWEWILKEKPRFYLYNPVFIKDTRVNMVQAWDYNPDGSMTFNLLYTFEKENNIYQKEIFEEHYHPFDSRIILDKLKSMGYSDPEIYSFPAFVETDFNKMTWYAMIAKKEVE